MGKLSDRRMARIVSLLKQTLSEIILSELKDPRLGIFSITDVRLSRDMSYADVSVSAVGGKDATGECVKVLESASPLLRNRLRDETDLRIVPALRFHADKGMEYQQEIEKLLQELPPAGDDEGG